MSTSTIESRPAILRGTAQRKQLELEQREGLFMDCALDMLEASGFSGLTLEKLATRTNFSKGTVYNHFTSKEDLFTALCVRGMQMQMAMFSALQAFEGSTRERMMGMHYAYHLYAQRHPTLFMCVLTGLSPHVVEKTSARRMADRQRLEARVTERVDTLVREAVAAGDLRLPPGTTVADISFAHWAVSFGTTALLQSAQQATSIRRLEVPEAFRRNVTLLLDGMGWTPLSTVQDDRDTWRRLGEVFRLTAEPTPRDTAAAAGPVMA
ncbi:TetR/AcrR family transcriptional regulator [Ideonella livida]|uniref:TetR/AcrR family transcriptional regulator n=1 Tax=Ideonella livida TaxID=2707176 RepID=A0A7C9PID2_9BURK|nr:TetR/AcrR family transcriptional regulator [Ideonella livida]NDY91830.1 TetR/AcrR family transcriptional regulator [Ideonella livida]